MATPPQRATEGRRDLFLSHASEEKGWVGPLAVALMAEGLHIWYDEYEFQIGDNVRAKMDQGLLHSRYGLVVLSPTFFEKFWTQYELDGLFARQSAGEQVILPIWHRMTMDEIARLSPSLTNTYALNSSVDSVDVIANKIAVKVKGATGAEPATQPQTPQTVSAVPQSRSFGVFYIAQQGTPALPQGQMPERTSFLATPTGWLSVTQTDEELEHILDGSTLRVRLDWDTPGPFSASFRPVSLPRTRRVPPMRITIQLDVFSTSPRAQGYTDTHIWGRRRDGLSPALAGLHPTQWKRRRPGKHLPDGKGNVRVFTTGQKPSGRTGSAKRNHHERQKAGALQPVRGGYPNSWPDVELRLQAAHRHLRTFEREFSHPEGEQESCGFSAQQAVENAMKAWMSAADIGYQRIHDLQDTADRILNHPTESQTLAAEQLRLLINYTSFEDPDHPAERENWLTKHTVDYRCAETGFQMDDLEKKRIGQETVAAALAFANRAHELCATDGSDPQ